MCIEIFAYESNSKNFIRKRVDQFIFVWVDHVRETSHVGIFPGFENNGTQISRKKAVQIYRNVVL